MRKLGLVSRWLLVGLVGVMLIMAGISRIVDAQTGGCPNLEAVEGGWGNWSSCFQSQQDGIWKCIAYRFPDTCVQTWRRTLCKPYGTDSTYSWKPCTSTDGGRTWTCLRGDPRYGNTGGQQTHYITLPCP